MLQRQHLPGLLPQIFNFLFQFLVFRNLDLEELHGDSGFFLNPSRGKQVGIAFFDFAVAKIVGFHQAFFNQRLNAIVHPPQADAELSGQSPLADFGIGFQQLQYFVPVFIA